MKLITYLKLLFFFFLLIPHRGLCSGDSLITKPKIYRLTLNLDSRQSFIKNREVSMLGIKAGLQWKDKLRTGLGYYQLFSPLNIKYLDAGDTLNLQVKFSYYSIYLEYLLFHKKRWELSIPLQFGIGTAGFYKQTLDNVTIKAKNQTMTLGEISVNGYYKVFSWIGLDAGLGYRMILDDKALLKRFFDAPIYTVKLKIFIGEAYYLLFRKKKIDKAG